MLSEHRDEEAATAFFKQAINNNGFPDKIVMDKSGANYAGLALALDRFIGPRFPFRSSLSSSGGGHSPSPSISKARYSILTASACS
jgi:transposase-like protein